MLYTGPWHDAIVSKDGGRSKSRAQAFSDHFERRAGQSDDYGGCISSGLYCGEASLVATPIRDVHVLGVLVGHEICAAVEFAPIARRNGMSVINSKVYEAAIWVEPACRRQRMAYALLIQCTTVLREKGATYMLINGLGGDQALRRLARKFSADLTFAEHDCQAWIEIGHNIPNTTAQLVT